MKRDIKYIMTVSAVMLILQGCGGDSVTSTDKPETKITPQVEKVTPAENTLQTDGTLTIPSSEKEEKIIVPAKVKTTQNDKETNSEFVISKDNETIDIQNDQTNSNNNNLPEGIVIPQNDESIVVGFKK